MNTSGRYDIYAQIHKALRLFMTDTLRHLSCLDIGDEQELEGCLAQLEELLDASSRHLQHENEFVHPVIEAHHTGLTKRIAEDHQDHLDAISALRLQAAHLLAEPATVTAHQLYRQLGAFVAENFEHMEREEASHNPVLWAACSDEQLQAVESRILASIDPKEMSMWMRWLIPALSPQERAQLLAGLPEAALAPTMASARALLDDTAWAKLCRALGQAPVPGLVAA